MILSLIVGTLYLTSNQQEKQRKNTYTARTHCFTNLDLLVFCRIHVSLWPNDQFGTSHGTFTPNFRIISIITNDHANLHPFRSIRYERS